MSKTQEQTELMQSIRTMLSEFCETLENNYHEMSVLTNYGRLGINLHADTIRRGKTPTFTIFTRFDQPTLARAAGIDCNPHSGKWNWHFLDRQAAIFVVAEIQSMALVSQQVAKLTG